MLPKNDPENVGDVHADQFTQKHDLRLALSLTLTFHTQRHLRAWCLATRAERLYSGNLKRSIFAHWSEIVEEVRFHTSIVSDDSIRGEAFWNGNFMARLEHRDIV